MSGDDVIVIDICGPARRMEETEEDKNRQVLHLYANGKLTPGTRIRRLQGGKMYEVMLPTGMKVEVKKVHLRGARNNYGSFLDIFVYASPMDRSYAEGIDRLVKILLL